MVLWASVPVTKAWSLVPDSYSREGVADMPLGCTERGVASVLQFQLRRCVLCVSSNKGDMVSVLVITSGGDMASMSVFVN